VGRTGVVQDISLHQLVCRDISDWLTNVKNWRVLGIEQSPIKGPKGNIEFLIIAKFNGQ
jgi:23S rRNA (cytidine1920-2'-O)/16S rRNA (cytidine1409-2'-O)-methyltransferase